MNKLWVRITLSFFIVLIVGLCMMFFFVDNVNRTTYNAMTSKQLTEESELLESMITKDLLTIRNTKEMFSNLKLPENLRFTIIDKDGRVIFDTDSNIWTMSNHIDRPEIKEAKRKKTTSESYIRQSDTEEIQMMYVAVPITEDGEVIGYVRSSTPLETIEAAAQQKWVSIVIVFTLILVATIISAALLAYKITNPIQKIIEVTERLKKNDYSARINDTFPGELYTLSESVNSLAISLNAHVTEIKDQSKQLESILSNLNTGVILINPEGEIDVINDAALKMINQTRDKILNNDYQESLVKLNVLRDIRHVYKYDEVKTSEVHLYNPEEMILNFYAAPYYGERWEKRGVIVALHDITDIKRLENIRRDFVANVSHELKTPITSIQGFSETLLESGDLPREVEREFLEIIYNESVRLNKLIIDILNLSKIEKHQIRLNETNFDLTELVHTTARPMKRLFKDRNLQLHLPENEEHMLYADKERVAQILVNLLSNAANYTHEGDTVEVKIEETNDSIELSVHDTGAGIPEESLSRLFERFYRVDSARSTADGGTGLGLSIVKHLVELHNASITVDSIEGEYTTFTVTFKR